MVFFSHVGAFPHSSPCFGAVSALCTPWDKSHDFESLIIRHLCHHLALVSFHVSLDSSPYPAPSVHGAPKWAWEGGAGWWGILTV